MTTTVYGLMNKPREYRCDGCATVNVITTNHTGDVRYQCQNCSWKTAPRLPAPECFPGNRRHEYVGADPVWPTDYNYYAMSQADKARYIDCSVQQLAKSKESI